MVDLQPTDVLIHYQSVARRSAIHHIFTAQNGTLSEDCSHGNYCKQEGKIVLCRNNGTAGLACAKDQDVE